VTPEALPADWRAALSAEFQKPTWATLSSYLSEERASQTVFPPENEVFTAFHATPFDQVKVVLFGQDPYHGPGQAHGMSFSVKPGVAAPPSLNNMFKELKSDLGHSPPDHGNLTPWARQGMLLLNAVLTVRKAEPNSHAGKGWEQFTDAVIGALNARSTPVVFLLWGSYAKKKAKLIKGKQHKIIEGTHPSPLSAHMGFFGSKPYSKINEALVELGHTPINWALPSRAALGDSWKI
jgi:uracil-DNA glycosylase